MFWMANWVYYFASFSEQTGTELLSDPFMCCIVPNFIDDVNFLDNLQSEVFSERFYQKNNDLYQFKQVRLYVANFSWIW